MTSLARTPTSVSLTLAVAWTLCVTLTFVLADEPRQYFNLLPLASADDAQLPVQQTNPHRLSELLQLKSAMYDRSVPPESGLDNSPQLSANKRVFCNGFTGCGGRFRLRRRQKRPFCNTYGCYNSGKKRANEVQSEMRDDAPELAPQVVDEGWSEERLKRLFCNGYGGCQNMGKRRLEDKQGRLLPAQGDEVDTLRKRFFSGDAEKDFDELANNMTR